MYDTIRAYKMIEDLGTDSKEIVQHLRRLGCTIYHSQNETLISGGPMRNLQFKIEHGKLILYGSLCKFYKQNNLETLSRKETQIALIKLQKSLNIPILKFKLSRLDIAENILLTYPVSQYLALIQNIDKHSREPYGFNNKYTGIYFRQTQKQVLLYNKYTEVVRKKTWRTNDKSLVWADSFESKYFAEKGKHVLRFEFRLMQKAGKQLGNDELTLAALMRPTIWRKCARLWFVYFMKLQRKGGLVNWSPEINTVIKLRMFLMRRAVESFGGTQYVIDMVRRANKESLFQNRKQSQYIIKELRKIYFSPVSVQHNNEHLYQELKNSIIRAAANFVKQ